MDLRPLTRKGPFGTNAIRVHEAAASCAVLIVIGANALAAAAHAGNRPQPPNDIILVIFREGF